jgi:hypothetical protein
MCVHARQVGLEWWPAESLPSEESMIRFEKLAKAATRQGRCWIGSADGEDLQKHFVPSWKRTPDIDMVSVGAGLLWFSGPLSRVQPRCWRAESVQIV